MKRTYIQRIAFVIILIIAVLSVQNPYTTSYVDKLTTKTSMPAINQTDSLYEEIEAQAEKYFIPASDAKNDHVWKLIPGYNGLKVNIAASYEKMKRAGVFNEKELVFEQVPPKVHLNDLTPEPIYRGHPQKPMVSFLINVAWGNEYIPDMLETFKKHNITSTFFLEGRWTKENPELAKMIVDAGHEIGNHSYSHPNMKTLSAAAIREQLIKTNDVIEATTGKKVALFAPPSGNYRDEVVKIAAELNLYTIMWSVDTIDWQKPEPYILVNRVMEKIHPGAMILMHPTSSTAQALETLILSIQQKNYYISNVSSLLSEERIK